ncbi:MAG: MFS transporter [Candidatus Omnitrophota bacterium]|nr:MFS transporter [Candidatus Omnitrophota bacterium]
MSRFREILKNRNFFLLWVGQIISQFGDRLDQMALIALIYARHPGSTLQLAKLISFTIIPVFLIGPLAGVYVDRWDRRRTLFICDILRGILIFLIPAIFIYQKSLIPIYLIVFLAFCVSRFYVPAKMSIVPDLVKDGDLLLANSLVNTTGMIAAMFGFGLGGILVAWLGVAGGFYLDSISFFISGVLIFLISAKINLRIKKDDLLIVGREVLEVIRKSVAQEFKESLKYLLNQKEIRLILNILFILWSALGAIYVVIIVFVQETLESVTKDLGLLIMFLGLGLFLGSLVYGRLGQRLSHFKVIFFCLILGGIMLIVFSLSLQIYPHFLLAALLSFVFGMIISPIMIASNTLVHEVSQNEMRGKIFSYLEIVMHFAFLLSMLVSSVMAEFISRLWILIFVGIVFSLVGIVGYLRYWLKLKVNG